MKRCRWCFWRRTPEQDDERLQEAQAVLEKAIERAPRVAAIVEETKRQGAANQFGQRFAAAFYSGRPPPRRRRA